MHSAIRQRLSRLSNDYHNHINKVSVFSKIAAARSRDKLPTASLGVVGTSFRFTGSVWSVGLVD